jgi:hypothetical protein
VKLAVLTQTSQKYPQLPKNKGVRTRTVIDKFIAYYIEDTKFSIHRQLLSFRQKFTFKNVKTFVDGFNWP